MTSAQRGVRFCEWLIILWLSILFTAAMAVGQARLGVPAYQDPGSAQWTAWAAPGAKSIGVMIVNLNNGDDEHYYASVDRAIRATRKQGIFVLGYTYTGYGARDPKMIRQKIDAVYRNYLVDGMFFDEAPTDCNASNPFLPTQFLYYEALTNYVREKAGARVTVLNPGTYSPSDCWMGITNILMNWEDQGLANYENNYVDYAWVHKYPPDRFWHIVYGMSADQLQAALALAKQRNAGWVYLTQETGNPYASPPQYWGAESKAVKEQAVQAPFASAWPSSFDAQGARARGRPRFVGAVQVRRTGRYFSTPTRIRRPVTTAAALRLARNTCSKPMVAQPICCGTRAQALIGTGRKSLRMPISNPSIQAFRLQALTRQA